MNVWQAKSFWASDIAGVLGATGEKLRTCVYMYLLLCLLDVCYLFIKGFVVPFLSTKPAFCLLVPVISVCTMHQLAQAALCGGWAHALNGEPEPVARPLASGFASLVLEGGWARRLAPAWHRCSWGIPSVLVLRGEKGAGRHFILIFQIKVNYLSSHLLWGKKWFCLHDWVGVIFELGIA